MSEKAKNRLKPDVNAKNDHSTFRTDEKGFITCIALWIKNIFNPSGFQLKKRIDVYGEAHNGVPTPHVHEGKTVRPALKSELPKIIKSIIIIFLIISICYLSY